MADPITEQQTSTAPPEALKAPSTMKALIETLIFAADEPLTVREIKAIYEQQAAGTEERHIEEAEIQAIIETLNQEYRKADRGYRIVAIAGGFQFATMQEYAEWIGRLYKEQARRKLSQSSLESLSIIAYKQPITKPEIESIRGVNCDYVMKTLLEKDLVTIVGRAETVGRPLLYGTTREFLKHFGLNDVTDLPRPREIEEILGESQFETERRMLEAQAGADHTKKEEEDFKSRLPHIPKKKPEMDETVQIVPKKRLRSLTVRPKEEELQLDQPQHEPAPDVVPHQVDLRQSAEGTETPDSVRETSPAPSQDEDVSAVEMVEDTLTENIPQMEIVETQGPRLDDVQVPPPEPLLANEAHSSDYDLNAPPQSEIQTEPESPQPRRSRWTTWKQKLQTFIRKLFD